MKQSAVTATLKNNPEVKVHEVIRARGGLRYQITYKGKPRTLCVNRHEVTA